MSSGGARQGAGRKKLPPEIKRNKVNFYVTLEEKEKVKEFLKQLRGQ